MTTIKISKTLKTVYRNIAAQVLMLWQHKININKGQNKHKNKILKIYEM